MGVRITVGARVLEAQSYSVQEASTPLSSADTSGSVGTITFDVPHITDSHLLIDQPVRLSDSRKGFTLGKVLSVSPSQGSFLDQIVCTSRLGDLNIYNVQAQPYIGTLEGAFRYYVGLAGVVADVFIDTTIRDKAVTFPGWSGELWFYLKQMASAVECDISLVSGVILLRPLRTRVATQGKDLDRGFSVGGTPLAQSVEVYKYENRAITNELIYPAGGWSSDVQVINVNAGERVEQVLELSSSVSSIVQPVIQTFVGQFANNASVYTVVGDDGLVITPTAWDRAGGRLVVTINPDTTSLTVAITAPNNLPNASGKPIRVYSIALAADTSGSRYSTLRILGTGVGFNKSVVKIPTGIAPTATSQEVGATVDNPFLSSMNDVFRAGIRVAKAYTGSYMTLDGSVTAINRRGDSGAAQYPTYAVVQSFAAGRTYAQVQSSPEYLGKSYSGVESYWYDQVRDDYANQLFGNVGGARMWDQSSRRWYRIREGDIGPDNIGFSADDDVLHSDFQLLYQGRTYAQVTTFQAGLSYRNQDLKGLKLA